MTTSAPGLAGVRLALAGVQARQVLVTALVLLWAAWLIALWMTQPRLVPPDRLDEDLPQGRVTEYAVVVLREDGCGMSGNSPAVVGWLASGDGREQLSAEDRDDGSPERDAVTIAYWVDSRVADLRVIDPAATSAQGLGAVADHLDEGSITGPPTSPSLPRAAASGWPGHSSCSSGSSSPSPDHGPRPAR